MINETNKTEVNQPFTVRQPLFKLKPKICCPTIYYENKNEENALSDQNWSNMDETSTSYNNNKNKNSNNSKLLHLRPRIFEVNN